MSLTDCKYYVFMIFGFSRNYNNYLFYIDTDLFYIDTDMVGFFYILFYTFTFLFVYYSCRRLQ